MWIPKIEESVRWCKIKYVPICKISKADHKYILVAFTESNLTTFIDSHLRFIASYKCLCGKKKIKFTNQKSNIFLVI